MELQLKGFSSLSQESTGSSYATIPASGPYEDLLAHAAKDTVR